MKDDSYTRLIAEIGRFNAELAAACSVYALPFQEGYLFGKASACPAPLAVPGGFRLSRHQGDLIIDEFASFEETEAKAEEKHP